MDRPEYLPTPEYEPSPEELLGNTRAYCYDNSFVLPPPAPVTQEPPNDHQLDRL